MPIANVTIALASDHAGFRLKELVRKHLNGLGYPLRDFGTDSDDPVDYPLYIRPAALAVADSSCRFGIIFGGTGLGEAMVANKIHGVRCAVCWNTESARLAREHNDANMLAIGQRLVAEFVAVGVIDTFLAARFQGGRHERRVALIEPE